MHEVLTTKEAAEYLRTSVHTVTRLAKDGKLPAAKLGNGWRFLRPALDRWLSGDDQYEDRVDQGLVDMVRERRAEGNEDWVPREQVKAESDALP